MSGRSLDLTRGPMVRPGRMSPAKLHSRYPAVERTRYPREATVPVRTVSQRVDRGRLGTGDTEGRGNEPSETGEA
jgi:hypothetical protein